MRIEGRWQRPEIQRRRGRRGKALGACGLIKLAAEFPAPVTLLSVRRTASRYVPRGTAGG